MSYVKLSKDGIAKRIAQDIEDGAYINLGIGLPTRITKFIPKDKDVFLHSENGLLAFGPPPLSGEEDDELINAGKEYVTMLKGGSYFHHGDSFAMIRGGHIDICVLGAFQVASNGDLANWSTGALGSIPAVGGAMDLAVGAKKIFVAMEHVTKNNEPKIVEKLNYPVTGKNCVNKIYTDLCVINVSKNGLLVIEMVDGLSFKELQSLSAATLIDARDKKE